MHATGLLLGSALALAPLRARFGWLGLVMLALLVLRISGPVVGIPLAEIATALLLCAPPALLGARPLTFLGRISYGIYLWHYPLWRWLRQPQGVLGAIEVLPLTLGLATLSYGFVELRFQSPSRAPARTQPAPVSA
jgi:peptidoglycan/LPS O-acetylase OafA/YrhL